QIILNMDEVSSTIGEKQNVRSSEAWSREINRALKKGIPQIGTEHLIKDVSKPNLAMSLIWTSMGAWISSLWFINGGKPEYQAAVTAISIIAHHNFINFFARNFNFKGEDGMRFSFFNGPELDRALVLSVLSRTKTLAKEIKQIN
ncbi:MAG: hypothetical protein M1268_02745, partial [Patescibacteria group bacterium]|nr:hypothetical protein [Patescibacteria group bacterium]